MKGNPLTIEIGFWLILIVCLYIYLKTPPSQSSMSDLKKNISYPELHLKKLITISNPEINNKDIEDWKKVNILRQWAAENIPWATSGSGQINNQIRGKEAPHIFNLFDQNKGGVDCGGAGYSLMKLYKLYGFESYEYHYGNLDDWNHAITLVKINHKGKNLFVIEDAHFNTTYSYLGKEPVDFFDFLKAVSEGNTNNLKLVKNGNKQHLSIDVDNNKRVKHYEGTDYYYLENHLSTYLIPRSVESVIDGEDADIIMKKIQSLVVY